eukprot:Mrub_01415.p1 GENE.Mrub_01415~~Mrub_01415.p1  ORF type:complete len:713 (+),score=111.66 Mrub_01415:85-2139(+)
MIKVDKTNIGHRHESYGYKFDKKEHNHNLSPKFEKPAKDYKLDIKNYIVPLYNEKKNEKTKSKQSNLDSLSQVNYKLNNAKTSLDKYLNQLPKLDVKKALKKNVTFRNLHQQSYKDNTSRATTSSEKFRVNSINTIHRNNILNNVQPRDDRINPADRNTTLLKSQSHANYVLRDKNEKMEFARLSQMEELNIKADFSAHMLDQDSTRYNTYRDKPSYRTHRSNATQMNTNREEYQEFVAKYEHTNKCGVPMCMLQDCNHRNHPIDAWDENDDIVDVKEDFEYTMYDNMDKEDNYKYWQLKHQRQINENNKKYYAEYMLEKSRKIDDKVKNCIEDLRKNSFYKSISNKEEPGKMMISDRLKKVATVYYDLNKQDNTDYKQFYGTINSQIEKMQKMDDYKKNITNVTNFQNGIKKIWSYIKQDKHKALLNFKVFYRSSMHNKWLNDTLGKNSDFINYYNTLIYYSLSIDQSDYDNFSIVPSKSYYRKHSKYMFDLIKCSSFNTMVKEYREVIKTEDQDLNKLVRLLEFDRLLIYDYDQYGHTVLHLCSKRNLVKLAYNLISRYNVLIDPIDNFGYTPLFYAVKNKFHEMTNLLLYYGASIFIRDKDGVYKNIFSLSRNDQTLSQNIRRYIVESSKNWDDDKHPSIFSRYGWVVARDIYEDKIRGLLIDKNRQSNWNSYDYEYFNNY